MARSVTHCLRESVSFGGLCFLGHINLEADRWQVG